jgi:DNA processing protein
MTHHGNAATQCGRSVDEADRLARIALTWLAEPGNRSIWSLVQQVGAPAALDQLLAGDIDDTSLRTTVAARTRASDARRIAEIAVRRADRSAIRLITPSDSEWPTGIDDLATLEVASPGRINHDTRPPLCLWVRGDRALKPALTNAVAIVGARAATSYGVHLSTQLASGLAERGWTVISGGAYGADTAAHRGALATAAGLTVAVLACGLDRPYPAGNAALFDLIADRGLLVSEWPPGAEPLRHRFLIRNRLVAALTAGTVMVESALRSGASHMLRRALALKRPAMVVPGPVTSALSAGCHDMLRRNPAARLVTSVADVLEELGQSTS